MPANPRGTDSATTYFRPVHSSAYPIRGNEISIPDAVSHMANEFFVAKSQVSHGEASYCSDGLHASSRFSGNVPRNAAEIADFFEAYGEQYGNMPCAMTGIFMTYPSVFRKYAQTFPEDIEAVRPGEVLSDSEKAAVAMELFYQSFLKHYEELTGSTPDFSVATLPATPIESEAWNKTINKNNRGNQSLNQSRKFRISFIDSVADSEGKSRMASSQQRINAWSAMTWYIKAALRSEGWSINVGNSQFNPKSFMAFPEALPKAAELAERLEEVKEHDRQMSYVRDDSEYKRRNHEFFRGESSSTRQEALSSIREAAAAFEATAAYGHDDSYDRY